MEMNNGPVFIARTKTIGRRSNRSNARTILMPVIERASVKRAEWVAAGALLMSLAGLIFQLGVVWQSQQDQERRIIVLEGDSKTLLLRIERIDANVTYLADRAREDREKSGLIVRK